MAYTYGTLWEAFAGGEYEGGGSGLQETYTTEDYAQQTEKFYQNVVAPSMGHQEFVNPEYFSGFNTSGFQQAEEEFRMAIGDPYYGPQDPFRWEKLSRYNPQEAQSLLEGELYDRVQGVGGMAGEDYSMGMEKLEQDYKTSLKAPRENLTYASLTADISKQSGTSGLALKSGSGLKASEDVLAKAYKDSKTVGEGYVESMGTTLESFQSDLDSALTTYLNALDSEKETWFNTILYDVQAAEKGAEITEEFTGSGGFTSEDWQSGLTYDPESDQGLFREEMGVFEGSCPSGELYAGPNAGCVSYEEWGELGGWAPPEEEPWVPWTQQPGYDPEDAEWSSENTGAYEEFLTECDLGCGPGMMCVNDQCVPSDTGNYTPTGPGTRRIGRGGEWDIYGTGHGKTGGPNPGVR